MVVIGLDEAALATTCIGEATVAPFVGELMATPDVVGGVGVGVPGGAVLTVMAITAFETMFLESHDWTTSVCFPAAMLRKVSILLTGLP
jgi:hypothetical protein